MSVFRTSTQRNRTIRANMSAAGGTISSISVSWSTDEKAIICRVIDEAGSHQCSLMSSLKIRSPCISSGLLSPRFCKMGNRKERFAFGEGWNQTQFCIKPNDRIGERIRRDDQRYFVQVLGKIGQGTFPQSSSADLPSGRYGIRCPGNVAEQPGEAISLLALRSLRS